MKIKLIPEYWVSATNPDLINWFSRYKDQLLDAEIIDYGRVAALAGEVGRELVRVRGTNPNSAATLSERSYQVPSPLDCMKHRLGSED